MRQISHRGGAAHARAPPRASLSEATLREFYARFMHKDHVFPYLMHYGGKPHAWFAPSTVMPGYWMSHLALQGKQGIGFQNLYSQSILNSRTYGGNSDQLVKLAKTLRELGVECGQRPVDAGCGETSPRDISDEYIAVILRMAEDMANRIGNVVAP